MKVEMGQNSTTLEISYTSLFTFPWVKLNSQKKKASTPTVCRKCFARRVLLKTLIKLQEMVGADQEMVHKDYKAPLQLKTSCHLLLVYVVLSMIIEML